MAKKNNGHAVENLKERKLWVESLMYSGLTYLYVLSLGIWGIFFITADAFWQLLLGVVFLIAPLIMVFSRAMGIGERDYRLKNRAVLTDIHTQKIEKVNPFRAILYMLPFVVISLLLVFIAEVAKVQFLHGFSLILFLPTTLLFQGFGLFDFKTLSWFAMLSVSVMVVAVAVVFCLGYYRGIKSMQQKNEEMVNEIRSFE